MEEFKANFLNVVMNNYMNFNGRARRKEYWQFVAVNIVLNVAISVVFTILGMVADVFAVLGLAVSGLVGLGLLLPGLAVSVRRLHDLGKSGWFLLIALIPIVGPLYLLYLFIQEGVQGANEYGEDPKA